MGKGKRKAAKAGEVVVATIKIRRVLTEDGDAIYIKASDESGDDLALMDGLGMLRLAEDTLIHQRMEQAESETQVLDE